MASLTLKLLSEHRGGFCGTESKEDRFKGLARMTHRPRRCLRFYPAYTDHGRSQKLKTTRFSYLPINIVKGVAPSATANRRRLSPVHLRWTPSPLESERPSPVESERPSPLASERPSTWISLTECHQAPTLSWLLRQLQRDVLVTGHKTSFQTWQSDTALPHHLL